ncbi:chromate transporter [Culicoidibacter larvae]|uniref:chromate transporter n=1 Tax=Culicoidibacter larvae TaxID=2579976 RepID=UPI0018EFC682|nr:chromate transporter [Culicoidibacter larvae]
MIQNNNAARYSTFLKDVALCAFGSYGGPEAHFGVFTEQMVVKKQYITEEEMAELIALTSILPDPSSTQTIIAIGYKNGGPLLGLFTLIVWALPPIIIMMLFSFASLWLKYNFELNILKYIVPMAVGFILVAVFRLAKKVITSNLTVVLLLFGLITTYVVREAWIFPTVLIIGGFINIIISRQPILINRVQINPPWIYLFCFIFIALISIILNLLFDIYFFDVFYRFGFLIIGGGQVLIPLIYSELVEIGQHMSSQEFLIGYGLVQGLPEANV